MKKMWSYNFFLLKILAKQFILKTMKLLKTCIKCT